MKILILIFIYLSLFLSLNADNIDDRNQRLKDLTSSWNTNFKKHSIPYSELLSGGPKRDGIAPLDKPSFVSIKEASSWLKDNEPLIFVKINNESKAYPLQVLIWHEIVNDTLDNKKILVTFCPLCNASLVFNRNIKDKTYTFGTSGLLRHSDLVMYDRQSESLWQQFTGTGIVGDMTGVKLQEINSSIISLKDIKKFHPKTKILSKNTGFNRAYGKNPYSGYDNINSNPFLLDTKADERLAPMRRVATIELNNKTKAYSYKILKKQNLINDNFQNKKIVVFYKKNILSALDTSSIKNSKEIGTATIFEARVDNKPLEFYYKNNSFFDKQTNSKWNIFGKATEGLLKGKQLKQLSSGSHFWFAWAVFKPDTIIYKK